MVRIKELMIGDEFEYFGLAYKVSDIKNGRLYYHRSILYTKNKTRLSFGAYSNQYVIILKEAV